MKARPATPGQCRCRVGSPDGKTIAYQGCKRGLTDLETTMEDTHVWTIAADGTGSKEFAAIDNRQGPPVWSTDGPRAARSTSFHKQCRIRPRASTFHSRRRSEAVARFACLVRDLFAACPESEDSRRDPLEEWHSRPKILRIKVGSV